MFKIALDKKKFYLISFIFIQTGTPVHEICHALGLWHEHQRRDRDGSIKILYDNIGFWYRINFEEAPAENERIDDAYDYNSVLQYGPQVGFICIYLIFPTLF